MCIQGLMEAKTEETEGEKPPFFMPAEVPKTWKNSYPDLWLKS